MNTFNSLTRKVLTESVALTKGSQRVMNDTNLVSNLADAIRDDARSNPASFPSGSARSFQKAPDEQLAQWFLENIDKIEREGYEGIVYSRDGVNSDWIVRRYIAGSHNWEDLTGVMNMNLLDWYLLKNRNLLDANHKDLPKFNSVRDLGFYMTTHYKDKVDNLKKVAKNAERAKMSKSIKLVDNDDYRIYTTLNRAAGCALGLGTQWCTANSNYDGHFHRYSDEAMLFQLFPYWKEPDREGNIVDVTDKDGKKKLSQTEKFQFDAGGPNFMDVTDKRADPNVVRTQFPYLFTDLANALTEKKPDMEKAFAELSVDPKLQEKDFKIKTYEIDQEIEKLHKFVNQGFFTDKVRPSAKPKIKHDELAPEVTQESFNKKINSTAEILKFKGTVVMEEMDKDVAAMLQSLKKYDRLTESVAPVLMARPQIVEKDEGKHNNGTTTGFKAVAKKAAAEYGSKEAGEKVAGAVRNKMKAAGKIEEANDKNPWMDLAKKDDNKSSTVKTDKGVKHEKDYDSKNKKAKDDEDDELDEALQIMAQIAEANGIVSEEDDEDEYLQDPPSEVNVDPALLKRDNVKEGADLEVLEWMHRFSKLGNMKGYGR
jgi:hypothetical protein